MLRSNSSNDEFVGVATLAANAALPEGWVFNAIKSGLLGVLVTKRRKVKVLAG